VRASLAAVLCALAIGACAVQRGTIGAVLAQRSDGELFVRDVPENLGADKSGLRPGDQILLIEGIDVRGLSSERVHEILAGEVGDPVRLTVIRGEEVLRVTVKRTPAKKRGAVQTK
jgi:C-terminal processing protease CtpA/Prc